MMAIFAWTRARAKKLISRVFFAFRLKYGFFAKKTHLQQKECRKWLNDFSERIPHYGNLVIDIIISAMWYFAFNWLRLRWYEMIGFTHFSNDLPIFFFICLIRLVRLFIFFAYFMLLIMQHYRLPRLVFSFLSIFRLKKLSITHRNVGRRRRALRLHFGWFALFCFTHWFLTTYEASRFLFCESIDGKFLFWADRCFSLLLGYLTPIFIGYWFSAFDFLMRRLWSFSTHIY